MSKEINKTNILLKNIINGIQDVKGKEIISLDLRKIESAICKYFVICTGTSNTHVNAIEGSIKEITIENVSEKPWHVEGSNTGKWILMDYSDIVVHIFQESTRNFYKIEDFWGDAKIINYKES